MNPFLQFLISQQPTPVSSFSPIHNIFNERSEYEMIREILSRIRGRRFRNPFMKRNPFMVNDPFDLDQITTTNPLTPSPERQGVATAYDARSRRY